MRGEWLSSIKNFPRSCVRTVFRRQFRKVDEYFIRQRQQALAPDNLSTIKNADEKHIEQRFSRRSQQPVISLCNMLIIRSHGRVYLNKIVRWQRYGNLTFSSSTNDKQTTSSQRFSLRTFYTFSWNQKLFMQLFRQ